MKRDLLNEFIKLSLPKFGTISGKSKSIAEEWLDGADASDHVRRNVYTFVNEQWENVLEKFKGDEWRAKLTIYNLLDNRFSR